MKSKKLNDGLEDKVNDYNHRLEVIEKKQYLKKKKH